MPPPATIDSSIWAPGRGLAPNFIPRPQEAKPQLPRGREAAAEWFNELASKFPVCDTLAASITSYALPASGISGTAGLSAWLSLINFDPWVTLKQDIVVFGLWLDLLSTNPTPATPASQAAWGDDKGLSAAILINENLPIGDPGTWSESAPPIAGVESAVASVFNDRGRRAFARTFPTGKLTTGFNKRGMNGSIVPFVRRITRGKRICAALLVNGAQAAASAGKTIDGYIDVEIYFGYTRNPGELDAT